jgi:glycosyltransferase involved in cell wall biosynthesis
MNMLVSTTAQSLGTKSLDVQDAARPVSVCIVAPSLDILGGQAMQATRLLKNFRELSSIEVDLLPINPRLPGPLRLLQRIKYVRTIVTTIVYVFTLLRTLHRYDVIHVFSAAYWSFVLAPLPAMLVARIYRKRIILNYRSGEAEDHLRRSRLARSAVRLADEIVVQSGYLVDIFARFGVRAVLIDSIVEAEKLTYRERTCLRPVLLTNRLLEPLYNVDCVLHAFDRVARAYPGARLIMAGYGPEQNRLLALINRIGLDGVDFVGRVSPEKMASLYNEADVYVTSPNVDNMPNSVMESFAAGLPVVATRAGGIPYIVTHEENGLLVECGDSEGLANAVLRLLREPDLVLRLTARARSECLQRYVWSAVGRKWESLYLTLASRNGAHTEDWADVEFEADEGNG